MYFYWSISRKHLHNIYITMILVKHYSYCILCVNWCFIVWTFLWSQMQYIIQSLSKYCRSSIIELSQNASIRVSLLKCTVDLSRLLRNIVHLFIRTVFYGYVRSTLELFKSESCNIKSCIIVNLKYHLVTFLTTRTRSYIDTTITNLDELYGFFDVMELMVADRTIWDWKMYNNAIDASSTVHTLQ